jgi:hypothetical protein
MSERLEINVTFAGGYYHASHPRLPTICALSLAVLRKRVEEKLNGEDVEVRLMLDRRARLERDRRRRGGAGRPTDYARPR